MIPIVSFVGKHNAGKTTFLCAVVEALTQRGIQVAVIKHASHYVTISQETDSDRLFHAGAGQVWAVSPETTLYYRREAVEPTLDSVIAAVSEEMDLIITEGYKQASYPKIEVIREAISTKSLGLVDTIAMVSDFELHRGIPLFSFEQVDAVTDFVIDFFHLS